MRMANTAGVERKNLPRQQSGDGQLDSMADAERHCCGHHDHPAPAALMRTHTQIMLTFGNHVDSITSRLPSYPLDNSVVGSWPSCCCESCGSWRPRLLASSGGACVGRPRPILPTVPSLLPPGWPPSGRKTRNRRLRPRDRPTERPQRLPTKRLLTWR